jgi:hypothetical protein
MPGMNKAKSKQVEGEEEREINIYNDVASSFGSYCK